MANADSSRAPRASKPTTLNVDEEVAALRRMTPKELRQRYAEVFGEQSRSGNKQWLIKRIAWRMQANEEGDLSERARQRALEIANDADLRMQAPRAPKASPNTGKPIARKKSAALDSRLPMPGTKLKREYKGETIQVTVMTDGFEFDGEKYRSLSAVAKVVTGTHWNGFHFFGLQQKGGAQ